MRRRNVVLDGLSPGSLTMLIGSIIFLIASISFSIVVVQKAKGQSINDTLSKVGVVMASAEALPATANDSVVAIIPNTPIITDASKTTSSQALTAQLNAWINNQSSAQDWAIVVRSLDDNSLSSSINGQKKFESASIFKLYATYALSKTVSFDQWKTKKVNGNQTYADCVEAMMILSDNDCGVAVGDKIGWENVTKLSRAAGYTNTSLLQDPTPTTAEDTAHILTDFYSRKTVNDQVATFVFDAMSKSIFKKGIVAGCTDCQVSNKTGQLDGVNHDAAVITLNNKHYTIAIFSRGGSTTQIAQATTVIHDYLVATN